MRAHAALTCPRVARCAVLQTRREEDPGVLFTGVKWAALRVLGGCVPDRDVVYFEKAGLVRQETAGGRRLAYVAMQSVPPAMVSGLGRAGASMSLCYLLEELDSDEEGQEPCVGVYMLGAVAGFGPVYLMASVFGDLALAITRAADVARAIKLAVLIQTASALGDADVHAEAARASVLSRVSGPRRRIKSTNGSGSARCDECGGVPYVFESLSACAGCRRPHICRRCRTRERVLMRDPLQQRTSVRSAVFCAACRAHVDSRPLLLARRQSDAFLGDGGSFPDRSRTLAGSALSDDLLNSARSLAVFSLKISQHLLELDQQGSDARASVLSSLGTDEMARLLLSSGKNGVLPGDEHSDEESDVLESFHAPPKRVAAAVSPSERPRLSRYSTASSTSSSCAGDEALEAHRHSLFSRLKAATDQAEQTFYLAHAHSQTARAVWMRSRFQWVDLE